MPDPAQDGRAAAARARGAGDGLRPRDSGQHQGARAHLRRARRQGRPRRHPHDADRAGVSGGADRCRSRSATKRRRCRASPRRRWRSSGTRRGTKIACPRQPSCSWACGSGPSPSRPDPWHRFWRQNRRMRRLVALLIVVALAFPGTFAGAVPASGGRRPAAGVHRSDQAGRLARPHPSRTGAPGSRETCRACNGRKLNVRVDVFGQAPPLDFFPTGVLAHLRARPQQRADAPRAHRVRDAEEFRSPAPISRASPSGRCRSSRNAARKRNAKTKSQIYRAHVMQGIAVIAPRCTQ